MAKPVLKLNGKPLDLNPPSPTAVKLTAFLESSPPDELFTLEELSRRTQVNDKYVQNVVARALAPNRLKVGRAVYYGSVKAIAALKLQIEQQR